MLFPGDVIAFTDGFVVHQKSLLGTGCRRLDPHIEPHICGTGSLTDGFRGGSKGSSTGSIQVENPPESPYMLSRFRTRTVLSRAPEGPWFFRQYQ